MRPVHIISHNDLDGVTAAALAWRVKKGGLPPKVSMTGYGDVDNLIADSLKSGQEMVVLDLFCQRRETIDEIDKSFTAGSPPFIFDHHQSNLERYSNRGWAVVDTSCCGALVYWNWLYSSGPGQPLKDELAAMKDIVYLANDRDLWINKDPDSRLWHAMVTLCGTVGIFSRIIENPSPVLLPPERQAAENFVIKQEERFAKAVEALVETKPDKNTGAVSFLGDGYLEFGDVSDFCGLLLDGRKDPPALVAVAAKRAAGDWAVSMRSRESLAGRVVSMLRDGKKVRGGGHGDAAALYFPPHYREDQIRESIVAALRAEISKGESTGVTLGDLFKDFKGLK